jgi:hypothetical protein
MSSSKRGYYSTADVLITQLLALDPTEKSQARPNPTPTQLPKQERTTKTPRNPIKDESSRATKKKKQLKRELPQRFLALNCGRWEATTRIVSLTTPMTPGESERRGSPGLSPRKHPRRRTSGGFLRRKGADLAAGRRTGGIAGGGRWIGWMGQGEGEGEGEDWRRV